MRFGSRSDERAPRAKFDDLLRRDEMVPCAGAASWNKKLHKGNRHVVSANLRGGPHCCLGGGDVSVDERGLDFYGSCDLNRSVGCILAELLGRKALFPGKDYVDMLKLIVNILGNPETRDDTRFASEKALR